MERRPRLQKEDFKRRRSALAEAMGGGALILAANKEQVRNGYHTYAFRQNSNFLYLTGFEEPDAVLVFRPTCEPVYTLFVRPRDMEKEIWNGFRYGPGGVVDHFGADAAHPIEELSEKLSGLLEPVDVVYYGIGGDSSLDSQVLSALDKVRVARGRSGLGIATIADPRVLLGELRVIKGPDEISHMRKAAQISAHAHIEVMRHVRPGVNEMELQGVLMASLLRQGAAREAYTPIIAGGPNATCLHYVFNDQPLREKDLFLIDAAGEYECYAADITRTYPVGKKFSSTQAALYNHVLTVQKYLVGLVKPGLPYQELQDRAIEKLTEAMIDLKLLAGSVEENVEKKTYRRFYPHNIGHFLGLDVHDAGLYKINGQSRSLAAGMVLTVEPGIYVQPDDMQAPEEFRGLGVRIEDDILVTRLGHEVLTAAAPKEIDELESLIGTA